MKLAAKQLLALGVNPTQVRLLDEHAEDISLELRELVQRIIADWLRSNTENR